jgi:hypothetical protein
LALIAGVYKAIIISLFYRAFSKKSAKKGMANDKTGKSVRNVRVKPITCRLSPGAEEYRKIFTWQ